MKKILELTGLIIILAPLSLFAAESNDKEKVQSPPELSDEKMQTKEKLSDSSRQKELAETFIRFIPTEDIKAANAVPFPVDI